MPITKTSLGLACLLVFGVAGITGCNRADQDTSQQPGMAGPSPTAEPQVMPEAGNQFPDQPGTAGDSTAPAGEGSVTEPGSSDTTQPGTGYGVAPESGR